MVAHGPDIRSGIDLGIFGNRDGNYRTERCRSWSIVPRPRFLWVTETGVPAIQIFGSLLPRKEVIQPHLPVRLPCYDFTPITNPAFDGCSPCGLAHRLRAESTFVV